MKYIIGIITFAIISVFFLIYTYSKTTKKSIASQKETKCIKVEKNKKRTVFPVENIVITKIVDNKQIKVSKHSDIKQVSKSVEDYLKTITYVSISDNELNQIINNAINELNTKDLLFLSGKLRFSGNPQHAIIIAEAILERTNDKSNIINALFELSQAYMNLIQRDQKSAVNSIEFQKTIEMHEKIIDLISPDLILEEDRSMFNSIPGNLAGKYLHYENDGDKVIESLKKYKWNMGINASDYVASIDDGVIEQIYQRLECEDKYVKISENNLMWIENLINIVPLEIKNSPDNGYEHNQVISNRKRLLKLLKINSKK